MNKESQRYHRFEVKKEKRMSKQKQEQLQRAVSENSCMPYTWRAEAKDTREDKQRAVVTMVILSSDYK